MHLIQISSVLFLVNLEIFDLVLWPAYKCQINCVNIVERFSVECGK